MKDEPLVSIIIPTYNRANLIGETLESVLAQTYHNWECIVVDDGSTDYTNELLEFYTVRYFRIQYHHRPLNRPKGANACRNFGFELSKGKYIQWLDSDDILSENKIANQVKLLRNSTMSFATCKWGVFTTNQNEPDIYMHLQSYQDFNDLGLFFSALGNSHGYFPPHAYLFDRNLVRYAGSWLEYQTMNQDALFIANIGCRANQVFFSEDSLVLYRVGHNMRISSHNNEEKVKDALEAWKIIDSILKIRFKGREIDYVVNTIKFFGVSIKRKFPRLYKENKYLFTPSPIQSPMKSLKKTWHAFFK